MEPEGLGQLPTSFYDSVSLLLDPSEDTTSVSVRAGVDESLAHLASTNVISPPRSNNLVRIRSLNCSNSCLQLNASLNFFKIIA